METFDYIIIGGGSAGCVLASRLSEDPSVSVLLLEAGGSDQTMRIRIPVMFPLTFGSPNAFRYYTTPQPYLNNRRLFWPRGRVVGGSSSINAMVYIRGHRASFDLWESLGNPGWNYDSALPYFKKSQNQERGESPFHGVGGPLNVADLISPNCLSETFVEAAESTGIPHNNDFNGSEQEGTGLYQVTQKGGQRCSAAKAFLQTDSNGLPRRNLAVRTSSPVHRILFEGNRARSVCYGQGHVTSACREIILSGGSINSPQIMMLSGVGPADHLLNCGIPVVHDLPGVGQNLMDHLISGVLYCSKEAVSINPPMPLLSRSEYFMRHTGPLTSNIAESGAFVQTRSNGLFPDLQFHFMPLLLTDHGRTLNLGMHGFTIGPTLVGTRSRGALFLDQHKPDGHPVICANYLSEPEDLETLVEGVAMAVDIANTSPFQKYRGDAFLPGTEPRTRAQIVEHIRQSSETIYHPVGTCKMGAGSDQYAVVDSCLRVHGIEGLRVVDASIMPNIPNGNTNAPTIMIAERAADMIKQG